MNLIHHQNFDEERALYALKDAHVQFCTFAGPADGESALKECRNLILEDCEFHLRYPFWHVTNADIRRITMSETCRAAFWYDKHLHIYDSTLGGIKAFREMDGCSLKNCTIQSKEFGWMCRGLWIWDCNMESEYPFLQCRDMEIDGLEMKAKYSFQYCRNVTIRNSRLDTKDAFWHGENITVYDSVVKGEYLGWYSENLTLVRCKIIGTQPLCYCKGLTLVDCEMVDCDLSFENSEVNATVKGNITSVKNPAGGSIEAESIGEIILDEYQHNPGATEIRVSSPV